MAVHRVDDASLPAVAAAGSNTERMRETLRDRTRREKMRETGRDRTRGERMRETGRDRTRRERMRETGGDRTRRKRQISGENATRETILR
eukprot:365772-Chlamydomonas_euryale.AAC.4